MPATLLRTTRRWGTVKPPVGAQIAWDHPLAQRLSLVMLFNEGSGSPRVWLDKGALPTPTFDGSTAWGVGSHGLALRVPSGSTTDALKYAGTGITWAVPTTAGSLVAYTRPEFATGDNVAHEVIQIGANGNAGYPGYNSIQIEKGDSGVSNNLYMGWVYGTSSRVVAATAGLWSPFDAVQFAMTWRSGGTLTGYVNANLVGTVGSTTTGDTTAGGANNVFYVGNIRAGGADLAKSFQGAIDALIVHSRVLEPQEVAWLRAEPYAFIRGPQRRFLSIPTFSVAPPTADQVRPPSWRGAWRGSYRGMR